ncbi:sister chromatid cohesion 1 protein 1 [Syzygium oleosum]|uniref:sister chromatid cohesion 1 protein 1 n=1 Tax=Syzygium oleosum TaxID=219896 RepID=UPI0024B9C030|nr:sister chromatid cohesion 1 protein 1 [Syzygium oleosum]
MFYSHQLLARKAPLGQIWMAATMHAKINRRKLDKLDIIKICEEILNPSIPMALRLSGILMGGVVIVYERKVKLLYDDVTRFLVEINEAWKVKSAPDPTILPKGKTQAKREAVTLPDNQETEIGDIEQPLNFSDATATMGFQHTAYFAMRLDNVDETCMNDNEKNEDQNQNFHQADAANITLFDHFDPYQTDRELFNHFERFDIEGEDETQANFASGEDAHIPSTLVPSPPLPDDAQRDEVQNQHPESQINQETDDLKFPHQDKQRQGQAKRKAKRAEPFAMDYEQTIIPGNTYQSWLQNSSSIVSKRGRKRKRTSVMTSMKIAHLMELPPTVLACGLLNENRRVYYPQPLMELWMRSIQPPHDTPSGRTSLPLPPEPSSSSPPERAYYQDLGARPFKDVHMEVNLHSQDVSIEKLRNNFENHEMPPEIFMEGLRNNLIHNKTAVADPDPMVTPGNSGDDVRSIPSSASGHNFIAHNAEVNSGRSSKKRPLSSSRNSNSGLEPVAEENSWLNVDPNFKLSRLPEDGQTPEQELLVETGPTQTQRPISSPPVDKLTDTIRTQMKEHFETPGAPKEESLNHLATGMSRRGAATLFYQTCVLATRDMLRVEQRVPYGDILISRGAKM